MQDDDEEEFDFTQDQQEETDVSPQVSALLELAFAKGNINLQHGDEDNIKEMLDQFGLPIPGADQVLLWEGLAGHDDANWHKSFMLLGEFIEEHAENIEEDKQKHLLLVWPRVILMKI